MLLIDAFTGDYVPTAVQNVYQNGKATRYASGRYRMWFPNWALSNQSAIVSTIDPARNGHRPVGVLVPALPLFIRLV
jgi:hypothetical protein